MNFISPAAGYFSWVILSLIYLVLWFVTLRNVLKSQFHNPDNKNTWLLIIILVPVAGIMLYHIYGKSQKIVL